MIKEEEIALYMYGGQVGMCHSFLPCSISFHLVFKDSKLAPFFFSAFMGVLQSSSLQLVAGMLTNAVLAGGRQPKSEKIKLYIYIYIYIKPMLFCFVRILISLLQFHLIWGGQDSNHVSHYWSGQVTHCLPHIFYPLI